MKSCGHADSGTTEVMGARVAITGLGAVTSVGVGVPAFLRALQNGTSAVAPITSFDTTGFEHSNGCEVREFIPADWICRLDPMRLGRATQFSIAAARMAIDDAGVPPGSLNPRSCGVSIGTTEGECQSLEQLAAMYIRQGARSL